VTRGQRQVLRIIREAPEHVRQHGVTGFYVRYGGHGLPSPESIEACERQLRALARRGLVAQTDQHPCKWVPVEGQA